MKGLSERIVLAAIILSCGTAMSLGSSTSRDTGTIGVSRGSDRSPRFRAAWLPNHRLLQGLASGPYQHRRQGPP